MKKRDILFIHESLGGGGAERVLVSILANLPPDRYNITLLLITGTGCFTDAVPENIEVITLFSSFRHIYSRMLLHCKPMMIHEMRRRALNALKERSFDSIVSFMEGPSLRLHYELMHLGRLNCSWIHCNLKAHHWYRDWMSRALESEIYRRMDRVAFVSSGAKNAFEALFEVRATKTVIGNIQDKNHISERAAQYAPKPLPGVFRLVTVGRLVPVKRHELLLEAVSILRKKGYRIALDILGTGPREEELGRLAARLGIENNVCFRGFVSNPYPYIRHADLICVTSESEGFSMVVAEALILGTPVMSTLVDGVTDMLALGGGIIVKGNAAAIAAEIAGLYDRPEKLKMLKDEAARSSRQFDLETTMNTIEDFIGLRD